MDDAESEDGRTTGRRSWVLPFLTGMAATGVGLALAQAWASRRRILDPRLIRRAHGAGEIAPVVVVPGIMGSGLLRGDGTHVWLNFRNAVGSYNLGLPFTIPLSASQDDLVPGTLLGADTRLPRLFGFTEYYDLLEVLEGAGFRPSSQPRDGAPVHHVFTYDWRRDIVEAARRLDQTLEAMAEARGDPDARFNMVAHSMGGLVARYYLRYGTAEPAEDAPVTWAGARRIRNLMLVAVPSGGSIPSLEGLLFGSRVGLSYTTLAAPVIARMPSVYQLLPPPGVVSLLDHTLEPLPLDLHEVSTWERFGWGPFAPPAVRRLAGFSDVGMRGLLSVPEGGPGAGEGLPPCAGPAAGHALSREGDGGGRRLPAHPGARRGLPAAGAAALRAAQPPRSRGHVRGGRRPRHPYQPAGLAPTGRRGGRRRLRHPRGFAAVHRQRRPSRDLPRAVFPERAAADAAEAGAAVGLGPLPERRVEAAALQLGLHHARHAAHAQGADAVHQGG